MGRFQSDKQRKAVMAKLKGDRRLVVTNSIVKPARLTPDKKQSKREVVIHGRRQYTRLFTGPNRTFINVTPVRKHKVSHNINTKKKLRTIVQSEGMSKGGGETTFLRRSHKGKFRKRSKPFGNFPFL